MMMNDQDQMARRAMIQQHTVCDHDHVAINGGGVDDQELDGADEEEQREVAEGSLHLLGPRRRRLHRLRRGEAAAPPPPTPPLHGQDRQLYNHTKPRDAGAHKKLFKHGTSTMAGNGRLILNTLILAREELNNPVLLIAKNSEAGG